MLKALEAVMQIPNIDLLSLITPSNLREAKEAWLNNQSENPQFVYVDKHEEARKIIDELTKLDQILPTPKDEKEEFLLYLIKGLIERQRLVAAIASSIATNDDKFTTAIYERYYGVCSPEITKIAYDLSEGKTIECSALESVEVNTNCDFSSEKTINAEELKELFSKALEAYGFNDWIVEINTRFGAITVTAFDDDGKSRLTIPEDRMVSKLEALKLIRHEVESHIRHYMNCATILNQYFDVPMDTAMRLLSGRDSTLTEGFAKLNDAIAEKKFSGKDTGTPLPWYVISADKARKGESFAEIADFQIKAGRKPEAAFNTTIRIFRGCHDTSNPYGFAREADRSYLEGFIEASKLWEKKSPLFDFAKFDEDSFEALTAVTGSIVAPFPDKEVAYKLF